MKNGSSLQQESKRLFLYGLGRNMTVSFLVFALIPLLTVSWFSYQKYYQSLENEIVKGLKELVSLKAIELKSFHGAVGHQLNALSRSGEILSVLRQLESKQKSSGQPLKTFVQSKEWDEIVQKKAQALVAVKESFGLYDLFLIGKTGDIIYTVSDENDLGTNILTGPYSRTRFSNACRRVLKTGLPSFSDYEIYNPSQDLLSGFFAAPIGDGSGPPEGIVAIQIDAKPLFDILTGGIIPGKKAGIFLSGPENSIWPETEQTDDREAKGRIVFSGQMKRFLTPDSRWSVFLSNDIAEYKGPGGNMVLAIGRKLDIVNIPYLVVAEIDKADAFAEARNLKRMMGLFTGLTALITVLFAIILARRIVRPILELSSGARRVTEGDFSRKIRVRNDNEIGDLAEGFNSMVEVLRRNREDNTLKDWYQDGHMELNQAMNICQDIPELSRETVGFISGYTGAHTGAFYIVSGEKQRIRLTGSFSLSTQKNFRYEFGTGDGIVGQSVLQKKKITINNIPDDYITISSGQGEAPPNQILVFPFTLNEVVMGVVELGTFEVFGNREHRFLELISESVAINIQKLQAHIRVQELLVRSQHQTEELESRQEELRETNQRLEEQTLALKESEENLKLQQQALEKTNEELVRQSKALEEQAEQLEEQKNELNQKNIDLMKAKQAIEVKAGEVETASMYKSEFLANMSHELRTPLNSIILLSKHLAENKRNHLSKKEVECAETVHTSGGELLCMINDVLDLAKVESGKMTFEYQTITISDLAQSIKRIFQPVADENGLSFRIITNESVPETIFSDAQRISQILKNLLSNAFKFTESGSVTLEIVFKESDHPIRFIVRDTGPGIPAEKQEEVFQAFKQADGSTSRKYGGTGLGLSISRDLAAALGGYLNLESGHGAGSVFTLALPMKIDLTGSDTNPESTPTEGSEFETDPPPKDEASPKLLIIDDEPSTARLLSDMALKKGFRTITAENGMLGLQMTATEMPDAVLLDMGLPDMGGSDVLFRLKNNPETRHIPVYIVSGAIVNHDSIRTGAVAHLQKPVSKEELDRVFEHLLKIITDKTRQVLVIEDDTNAQAIIERLIGNDSTIITCTSTGKEAISHIEQHSYDCIILDLMLPDMTGEALLEDLSRQPDFLTPIIIHTAREPYEQEVAILDGLVNSIVTKGPGSHTRLLDKVSLFLHRKVVELSDKHRNMLSQYFDSSSILADRKIMIVDDDMRNVFSLISVLEEKGLRIISAVNGKEALRLLEENPDTDLVLMDIMMPVMNGYEAIERIRNLDDIILSQVPVIAITANAMKGDRSKCLEAGANDYMSKPVDIDKLMSLLRAWLFQKQKRNTETSGTEGGE